MANDARFSFGFPNHPKTKKLARRLGPGGPWAMVCLILWAGQNRPDGSLDGMDEEDIELAAGWDGDMGAFVKAAVEIGFLDEDDEFRIHGWEEHQPWLVGAGDRSKQAQNAARMRWASKADSGRISQKPQPEANPDDSPMQPVCGEHAASMRAAPISNALPLPSLSLPIPSLQNTIGDSDESPRVRSRFEEWWAAYPKKVGKKPSAAKWKAKRLDAIADELIRDVGIRASSDRKWREGYIPNPATYLAQERWNDAIDRQAPGGRKDNGTGERRAAFRQMIEEAKLQEVGNG